MVQYKSNFYNNYLNKKPTFVKNFNSWQQFKTMILREKEH